MHSFGRDEEVVLLSLVKLRPGVDPNEFAEFSSSSDLPVWRSKDVILRFDTYPVDDVDRGRIGADFIEVIRVRSRAEWEEVGGTDPDIAPLAATFEALVDQAQTRQIWLTPIADA